MTQTTKRYGVLSTFRDRDLLASWQVLGALADEGEGGTVSHGAFAQASGRRRWPRKWRCGAWAIKPDGSRTLLFNRTVEVAS